MAVIIVTLLPVIAFASEPGDLNFEATSGDGIITVTWNELKEKDVSYVVFSSDVDGENYTEHKDEYQCNDGKYTYVIENLENNKTYTVGVEAASKNFKYGSMIEMADETHFAPDMPLTRAMLVTILYRLEGEPKVSGITSYADLESGQYYLDAVCWAQINGIANGISDIEFAPNATITREQIATIIFRYAQYKGMKTTTLNENLYFEDASEISEYAVSAMNWAVDSGLMKGKSATGINPKDNASRAEISAILHRFIESDK